jgi:hypothetical protein
MESKDFEKFVLPEIEKGTRFNRCLVVSILFSLLFWGALMFLGSLL